MCNMKKTLLLFLILSYQIISAQTETSLAQTALSLKEAIGNFEELKKSGNKSRIAQAAFEIGKIYESETYSSKAIEYYYLSLQNSDNQLDKGFVTNVYSSLAESYILENELDSVLFYQNKILDYFKADKDIKGQLKTLQSIAQAQETTSDYQGALSTYGKIIQLSTDDLKERVHALNNIGCLHNKNQNFPLAIEAFNEAKKADESISTLKLTTLYCNLGIAHTNAQNTTKAIEYFNLADKIADEDIQKAKIAHLIASTYLEEKDWYNAQQYNNQTMSLAQKQSQSELLSLSYATAAAVHQGLFEYEDALIYYQKHLNIRDSIALENRLRQQALSQQQFLLEKSEKEIKLLLVNEEINDLTINRLELERNNQKLETDKYALESAQKEASLILLKKEKAIQTADLRNQELAALQAQQSLRLTRQQLEAEQKDRNITDLKQKEALQELQLAEQEATEKERILQIETLNQQQAISDLELEKQATFRQGAYAIGGLMLLILGLMAASYWFARRSNRRLAAQKLEIEKSHRETAAEKEKSDALLLNILPAATAKELKETGVATPRHYDQVSVLFTDFVNFTNFAENISAEDLISELNTCFVAFDNIIEEYGLEKIKTIGDSYMCAGGIPTSNKTNASDAVKAGLAMQVFIENRAKENQSKGCPCFQMRLGIHTGAVVAGVVGKNKFAYDIWGDAVNLASRMESAGEIGTVNISEATKSLVEKEFSCIARGEIAVKNKGEVGMYIVS